MMLTKVYVTAGGFRGVVLTDMIQSLRQWVFSDTEPLDNWTYRQFIYNGKDNPREWNDPDGRPLKVGETWGGPNVSAIFKYISWNRES
jgi:hypothetical protein